jgi:hypothetical protein
MDRSIYNTVYVGPKKGCSRFLNLSNSHPSEKNIKIFLYCFLLMPTMFDYAIGVYLVKMFLLLIGQGSMLLLYIGWRNANSTLA